MDYFAVLGVKYDASPEEIKRAYRQKARQFHPDVNDAPGAEDQFRMVSEAYRVLSDASQRAAYVQARIQTASLRRRPPRKRYMHSQISLHIGCLIVGIILIAWVLDRSVFFMSGISTATRCMAVSWTPVSDGDRFRLTYSAPVPWAAQRIERSAILEGVPEGYLTGSFPCYYSESTRTVQLEPFEFGNVFRLTPLLPWGILGVVLTVKAGRFFFA